MRVVFIALYDCGGQNGLVSEAINKYSSDRSRSIVVQQYYLGYDLDLYYPLADMREMVDVLGNADFYCFQEGYVTFNEFDVFSRLTLTNHMVRWVGSMALETLPQIFIAKLKGQIPLQATTLDWGISSEIGSSVYIPLSIDFDALPKPERNPKKIKICQAPTSQVKTTDVFLRVMEEIQKEYPYVEPVLIKDKPWKECMRIKAGCDITFDNVWRGLYGHNSIEGMALGQPVLCGLNYYVKAVHPDCPIVACTESTLKENIIRLINDDELRKKLGEEGVEFAKRNHDIKKNVWRWLNLFHFIKNGRKERPENFSGGQE